MVRKFLASLLIFLFVVIISILLLVQSISSSFLNKKNLKDSVIPNSYEIAVELGSTQFTEKKEDQNIFRQRIAGALDKATYVGLLQSVVDSFFDGIDELASGGDRSFHVDLKPVKEKFSSTLPAVISKLPSCNRGEGETEMFRFCMPSSAPEEFRRNILNSFENTIKNEIPDSFDSKEIIVSNPSMRNANDYIFYGAVINKYFPLIIINISIILLVIVGLLIFRPFYLILRWWGYGFMSLTLFLGVLLILFYQISELSPLINGLSTVQKEFVRFAINEPSSFLRIVTVSSMLMAIFLFAASIILKKQKSDL